MINKKCARAVNELHFNPLPITGYMSDKLVLALFPNIQTQFLYHIYDRKINIANEHVINLDGYDIKYTVVDDSFHRKDPVLGCLYNKNGLYLPDIFLKHLPGRNIKFFVGIMYEHKLYVRQKTRLKTRLENLDIGYKWLVKQIFEKEKAEKVLSEEQRELPAKNRILKYLCVLFLDESSKLVFLDKSGILADTMNQFTIDIDWSELKKLDKRQRELSVGNIKNCILKRLCGLLLDESNKLTETMKQFIVDIDWNEWEALGEEKRKELEGQKKSGKIKGIVKRFCPRHQQDFEHYIVGTTFAVPRDVNYIKLNDIDFTVKRQIKQIDVSKSVNIIGPSCFSYYKNVTEIIFGNAGIKFNGERIFEGCSSIRRIYVSDVGECGLSYFVQKLIRACLDKYVKVIHCSDKWGVIDLPFLFGETDKPFMESLYSNKWGVIDLPFLFGEIGKPIMETLQERFWKKLGMI